MDEITQKVVDGTAWREFCDLLADAGEVILAEGNPDDPLDRAEGFRMLTRLLRGALESTARVRAADAARCSICTCHETIKIVGENPDNHYLGASLDGKYDYRIWGTRGDAKWISFNLFSGAGFGGGGPGTGATLHEEQMHIEPDGTLRGDHLAARAPRELAALRGRHPVARHPPDVPRQAQPGARRAPHRAHRRRRHPARAAHRRRSSTSRSLYAGLYVKGVAEIGAAVGDPPGAVAQRVHRRGRAARDRQVQGSADQVAPGVLRPRRRRGARRRGHAARRASTG